MGYAFAVMPAHIDERAIRSEDPGALTLALAHAKADALLPHIREKPAHAEEARVFLRGYAEGPAQTVTAVVVTHTATGLRGYVRPPPPHERPWHDAAVRCHA